MITKINFSQKLLTLLISIIALYSCSIEEENQSLTNIPIDYVQLEIDSKSYANSLKPLLSDKEAMIKTFQKTQKSESNKTVHQLVDELENASIKNEVVTLDVDISNSFTLSERLFLEDFLNEMSNTYDDQILAVITKHDIKLNTDFFTSSSRNKLRAILDACKISLDLYQEMAMKFNKDAIHSKSSGFGDCMAKKGGDFGRGIAWGALSGAAVGASVGAAVGGIGAIPRAVYGAAHGAIRGGAGALVWGAARCMFRGTLEGDNDTELETIVRPDTWHLDNPKLSSNEYSHLSSITLVSLEGLDIAFNLNP